MVDRRVVLKGLLGVGLGTATGGARPRLPLRAASSRGDARAFPIVGLPEALRGLRIGLLTDIHRSQTVSHEMVTPRSSC